MSAKKIAGMMLAVLLLCAGRLGAQHSVPLNITVRQGNGFTMEEVEKGVFEVTTAPGNATVRFDPLAAAPGEDIAVLSFDYFCASGMQFMVVMVNDDASRIEENMIRMPIAEGWSTFSVDVTDKLNKLQGPNDYLSLLIVPSTARPTTMRIKSPRLRAYTEKEMEQNRVKAEREEREKRLNRDIDVYLKKNHPCRVTEVKVTDDAVEVCGDIKGMPGEVYLCEVPMFGDLTDKDFITERRIEKPEDLQTEIRPLCRYRRTALRPPLFALGAGSEVAERLSDLLARSVCRRRAVDVQTAARNGSQQKGYRRIPQQPLCFGPR